MSRSICAGIRECSASTSCGAKQDGRSCASCPEAVGGAPAPGFAGDAGSAARSPGPGGERRSATRQNGASKTQPGVGESMGDVSRFARDKKDGQLSEIDSARALFRRAAENGWDYASIRHDQFHRK
jgi:hypothetical protein